MRTKHKSFFYKKTIPDNIVFFTINLMNIAIFSNAIAGNGSSRPATDFSIHSFSNPGFSDADADVNAWPIYKDPEDDDVEGLFFEDPFTSGTALDPRTDAYKQAQALKKKKERPKTILVFDSDDAHTTTIDVVGATLNTGESFEKTSHNMTIQDKREGVTHSNFSLNQPLWKEEKEERKGLGYLIYLFTCCKP